MPSALFKKIGKMTTEKVVRRMTGDIGHFLKHEAVEAANKPRIKLTEPQFKELMRRALNREGGKLTEPTAAEMMKFEPPMEEKMGTLYKHTMTPAGMPSMKMERYPIEQAREMYAKNPETYVASRFGAPATNELSVAAGEGDLAERIAYKRVKDLPVVQSKPYESRFAGKELEQESYAQQLQQVGVSPEGLMPDAKLAQVYASKTGEAPYVPQTPATITRAQQLAGIAAEASELWKFVGGGRGMTAKAFELYRKSSRQAPHIKDSRDYFTSCFIKFKEAPDKFAKAHPREAKIFNQIVAEREAAVAGGE